MQEALREYGSSKLPGKLLLKMAATAVAGSPARGGIYEVLKHAEELALRDRKLRITDDYHTEHGMEGIFSTVHGAGGVHRNLRGFPLASAVLR